MGSQSLWIGTELGAMAHRKAIFSNRSKLATATVALTLLGVGALSAQETSPATTAAPPVVQQTNPPLATMPSAPAASPTATAAEPAPSTAAQPSPPAAPVAEAAPASPPTSAPAAASENSRAQANPSASPAAAQVEGAAASNAASSDMPNGQMPLHGNETAAGQTSDGPIPPLSPQAQSAAGDPVGAHDIATPGDAPAPAASTLVNAQKLPHDLSPWGMFMQADLVVKSVMVGLILASIITWTVWLAKSLELMASRFRLRRGLRRLAEANSISEAMALVDTKRGAVPAMLRAALAETRASWDVADKYAIKDRIKARLERVELAAGRDISRGTGLLATIGSTAPFVGLFGTVWGIMNSFIGISESQTTNLAIVAPGIAEALLATAFGLVAAIPAVMIYNHFARSIAGYKALVGDASVAVLCIVSRDFDRGVRPELRAAE